jgi:copper chaperone CopZ
MTTETTTLHLPTLHCDACMKTARTELEKVGAVIASSDIDTKRVTVEFESEKLTRRDLEEAMEAVGFPADGED